MAGRRNHMGLVVRQLEVVSPTVGATTTQAHGLDTSKIRYMNWMAQVASNDHYGNSAHLASGRNGVYGTTQITDASMDATNLIVTLPGGATNIGKVIFIIMSTE
jgi:hypothetical protein